MSFLIGLQAFINIGVATISLPNKGIPLPFISYGGSNLISLLTCIGLVLSVVFHPSKPQDTKPTWQRPRTVDKVVAQVS
ncbi:MAG: FtsW/RodA/SpoVE family cell cycle protein [Chloroflexi bacterium]|nr:FtsW/RodA/SpoVE family cell cycle protein [Chloroflexota bacterium]